MATPASPLPVALSPVCGRHFETGEPLAFHHSQGILSRIEPITLPPSRLPWIAPSLFDLQINGFAGIDFQSEGLLATQLEHAAQGLLQAGCGRCLLTLITDEQDRLLARLRHLSACRRQSPLLQSVIAGWHLEGPYLSSLPGFHGAHPAHLTKDPDLKFIQALRDIVPEDRLLITLAPERPGALEAISLARRLGCHVGLGHTNADPTILAKAVAAGARLFTHLGNGCPQQLDRHDNVVWRVLDLLRLPPPPPPDTAFRASVIPDGHHVSPALLRTLYAAAGSSRLFFVSDAMAAAGAPPGPTSLGRLKLEVGTDQIVRQPGARNFAGSALRPIDGVFRAAALLGISWPECWKAFSVHPAQQLGLAHGLRVGNPADLCVFDVEEAPAAPPLSAQEPASPDTVSRLGRVLRVIGSGHQLYQATEDRRDR